MLFILIHIFTVFYCRMSQTLAPVAEKEERGGRTRYKLPTQYCRVEGRINIERVGPPCHQNEYICREEGCDWRRECVTVHRARQHARTHSESKKSHIFEGHLSADQLVARQKEKRRIVVRRYRGKSKQDKAPPAKKARTVRDALLSSMPFFSQVVSHLTATGT
jgi:hypothetical protein